MMQKVRAHKINHVARASMRILQDSALCLHFFEIRFFSAQKMDIYEKSFQKFSVSKVFFIFGKMRIPKNKK